MILIALGSNQIGPWGTPEQTIRRAITALNTWPTELESVSSFIKTPAFGVTNQPDFINAVAIIKTALSPQALMRRLHMIEKSAGRKRGTRWGPRTLDLDLLDYNGRRIKQSGVVQKALTLPHPGISQRNFVLKPISQIAPRWKHPVNHQSAMAMIQKL